MTGYLALILCGLLISLLAGMIRVLRGPTEADRMMAAQLFGTSAVAMMLVLSHLMAMPALLDVALVLAILAAVALVAFVSLSANRPRDD